MLVITVVIAIYTFPSCCKILNLEAVAANRCLGRLVLTQEM